MNIQEGIFYVMVNGKQYGPMKIDDLRQGLQQGHFTKDHLVWAPGFASWRRIGDTPFIVKSGEFSPSFAKASPAESQAPIAAQIPQQKDQHAAQSSLRTKEKRQRRKLLSVVKESKLYQGIKPWRQLLRHKRLVFPVLGGAVIFAVILVGAGLMGKLPWQTAKVEAYDSQAIYAEDSGDWQNYPDLAKEEKAIAKRQEKCIKALESGDAKEASKYFFPEEQEKWEQLMTDDAAGMKDLAEVLTSSKLDFMGPDNSAKDDPRGRIASFTVVYQGQQFEIVWLKYENDWYLYEV